MDTIDEDEAAEILGAMLGLAPVQPPKKRKKFSKQQVSLLVTMKLNRSGLQSSRDAGAAG